MKLNKLIFAGLTSLGLSFILATPSQAETKKEGYFGVGLSNSFENEYSPQVEAEFMFPLSSNVELRGTTDFNNEVDILPTVSIGLGDVADLYAGVGYNYDDGSNLLTRAGLDWNITENLVGLTYVDYTEGNDQVEFTTGIAHRFSGFSTSRESVRDTSSPRDRN